MICAPPSRPPAAATPWDPDPEWRVAPYGRVLAAEGRLAKLFLKSCLGKVPADIGDNLLKLASSAAGDAALAETAGAG
jgi:hypothetical protein